jgi:hypothetical protein
VCLSARKYSIRKYAIYRIRKSKYKKKYVTPSDRSTSYGFFQLDPKGYGTILRFIFFLVKKVYLSYFDSHIETSCRRLKIWWKRFNIKAWRKRRSRWSDDLGRRECTHSARRKERSLDSGMDGWMDGGERESESVHTDAARRRIVYMEVCRAVHAVCCVLAFIPGLHLVQDTCASPDIVFPTQGRQSPLSGTA